MNGHCRVVPRHQASLTSSGKRDRLAAAQLHHGLAGAVEPGSGPGDRAGKADAGEGAAGHGKIAGRLAVAMNTLEGARHHD